MRKANIPPGTVFGRLTVVCEIEKGTNGCRRFRFSCSCGGFAETYLSHVKDGHTLSCGCWHDESASLLQTTHGKSKTAEYNTWAMIVRRCTNQNDARWKDYGGRGITMCARWRESFEHFIADVGPKPSPKHSIDRFPDNNGPYEPGNVRWATMNQQARNQRKTIVVTHNGVSYPLIEFCEIFSLPYETSYHRIRLGWTPQELFNPVRDVRDNVRLEYNGRTYTLRDFCSEFDLDHRNSYKRLMAGWSVKDLFRPTRITQSKR